ncbi:Anti-sigma-F factor Fin [Bienertia sinuspersici]
MIIRLEADWAFDLFTVCYGLHTVEDRRRLWDDLSSIAIRYCSRPWVMIGDLNAVMYSTDRINGSPFSDYERLDLLRFIEDYKLVE